jgi:hypothetical protein
MIIYYVILENERIVGSRNKKKIEEMYPYHEIKECDISNFHGHLYPNDWRG